MSPVYLELTLPGYRIVSWESNLIMMRVYVEAVDTPPSCLYCVGEHLRSKGRYNRQVKHLRCFGRPSEVHVTCRRYRCVDCGKSFVQPLPGIRPGRHSSEPYREHLFQRHDQGSAASVLARYESVGRATVDRIYAQFTEKKAKERLSVDCPVVLGIDEHTLHKGQRFATTFCDLKRRRVFDISRGRSEAELREYLSGLKGREKVRVVCIDLSNSYRSMIRRWFPNAVIVADRFHAVRIVGLHLMRLARQLCPELGWNRSFLAVLRRRGERLDVEQRGRLQRLLERYPALVPIYEMKEKLHRLLCLKGLARPTCKARVPELLSLIKTMAETPLEAAQTLAKTLRDWIEEIARMWRFSRNNGITEGFHRKMKLIQRRAYGFRSFENYRLRVIAQCG